MQLSHDRASALRLAFREHIDFWRTCYDKAKLEERSRQAESVTIPISSLHYDQVE